MLKSRIITTMLWNGTTLVKGNQFDNSRRAGSPITTIKIYNNRDVDEILLGGLPLGSIKDETFSLEEFSFEKGDSLIFISDGLPEATNKENEMLGYEAVFECVKSNGEKNAESQKQALLDLGTSWLGDLQNQDDITIVVVKKTISLD